MIGYGFIGIGYDAIVNNLTIENATINGGDYLTVLVGMSSCGRYINYNVSGSLTLKI